VEYVNFLFKSTKHHGNSKTDAPPLHLPKDVPLLGPRFIPPSYLHIQKRHPTPTIQPQVAYLKPFNVVHPFYYAGLGKRCPQCDSANVYWDGWTTSGHRDVHGIQEEETVLGLQLLCKECKSRFSHTKDNAGSEKGQYCFATTNPSFWRNWEHWQIPRKHVSLFR
jgi:hypothetical protein